FPRGQVLRMKERHPMRRILLFAVAPLMVSAMYTETVLSNDEGRYANMTEERADPENASGVDAGTTASTGGPRSFGAVIAAMQESSEAAPDVANVTDASQVEIIRVRDIAEAESTPALEDALSQNEAAVEELQAAVAANATVMDRLA